MFKKPVESKSLQRLSGADRKKLRRAIKEQFHQASDADIDVIFPAKAEITLTRLANRVLVYGIEGGLPMFFDIDGRGTEIFPTVYALWKVPHLLPSFELKGGEVSRFVLGGADLMFPGISIPAEGLPSFLAGQPWAVKVPGNPAPIAVGTTTMSNRQAMSAGLRGKALRITHYYRDTLWESAEGHYVPNAGFLEDVVIEDPASAFPCQTSETDEHQTISTEGQETVEIPDLPSEGVDNVANGTSDEVVADLSSLNLSENISEDPDDDKNARSLSTSEVDTLLNSCLLQALHTTVKDKDLPMPGSTLWSGHVLPCRPSGVTLDIKKSSYKKLSKWLQSKSTSGLISAKEDKHKKEMILLAVNRAHPDYQTFRPEKRETDAPHQLPDSSTGQGHHAVALLDVVEVYKPSTHVNPIFQSVGEDTGKFYSASEATDIVFRYVDGENLGKPSDKAIVVLDATLCDALYKGTVKKGTTYPTEIHKRDLGSTFLSRLQVHHKVTRGNESVIRKGAVKTVQIMTERRQGNKKVTRVSGLETFLLDAEALASELQKKFACSTTVSELPGKKGQHEVLVQGGVIEDLARHLVDHYGIPKRYIEVLDKTKK